MNNPSIWPKLGWSLKKFTTCEPICYQSDKIGGERGRACSLQNKFLRQMSTARPNDDRPATERHCWKIYCRTTLHEANSAGNWFGSEIPDAAEDPIMFWGTRGEIDFMGTLFNSKCCSHDCYPFLGFMLSDFSNCWLFWQVKELFSDICPVSEGHTISPKFPHCWYVSLAVSMLPDVDAIKSHFSLMGLVHGHHITRSLSWWFSRTVFEWQDYSIPSDLIG